MTAAQKNAYLEAHMAVQQHMQHAVMQISKHNQQQQHGQQQGQLGQQPQTSVNQTSHQSPTTVTSTVQHYSHTIKVNRFLSSFLVHISL